MLNRQVGDASTSHHAYIDAQDYKVGHKHERKAVKKDYIIPTYAVPKNRTVVVVVLHTCIAVVAVVGTLFMGRCPTVRALQNSGHLFNFFITFFCVPGVNKTDKGNIQHKKSGYNS